MGEEKLKITGTRAYVDVETEDSIGRFGGEPCGNKYFSYFGAHMDDFRWIKYCGDNPKADKMKLVFEVMKGNKKRDYKVLFGIFSVREFVGAMEAIPDLIGSVTAINDTDLRWELPSGINIIFRLNEYEDRRYPVVRYRDWYVSASFVEDGKERGLEHWHRSADEVWEDVIAIQNGELFWVTKKNLFGKVSLPTLIKKEDYDRARNKDVYTVL